VILIDAQSLSASRPNRPLFADVSLTVSDGDRIGVVGLNGCGKSTLLRILSGDYSPDSGQVHKARNARIGILAQQPVLPAGTVRDAVGEEWRGEAMLDRLGMSGMLDSSTQELSGGQQKRVALAMLLVQEWDALILDEPTNHLDLDAIAYLEEWLANYRGGLILVTHDRHVLDRVTNKVLEIDRGKAYMHVPMGKTAGSGYAAYLAARIEREERAANAEQIRKNLARTELAWLRRGAPARTTKPKARMDAAKELISRKAEGPARSGELGLSLGSQRLGSKGVELLGVSFTWPANEKSPAPHTVLLPLDHQLEPGDRLGIVGPNGAGKSTLLDLISSRLTPNSGHIDIGSTVKIGYYDQLGRDLVVTQTVREAVAGDKVTPSVEDNNLMRRFWFDGDSQFAPISTLSGGERRRLQLLLTLIEQPNVLLLDEPTNDLDLDTLRALEEYLDDWPGIVVVVSHDRVFLDRTVNEVLALDGNGNAEIVRGGVAGWLAMRANKPKSQNAPQLRSTTTAPSAKPKTKPAKSASTLIRLVAQAEKSLAQANEKQSKLLAELALAKGDHAALAKVSEELAAAQAVVATAEENWIALAAEAEAQGLNLG
jgi:ATP-binding cassette subfamily F protein uup